MIVNVSCHIENEEKTQICVTKGNDESYRVLHFGNTTSIFLRPDQLKELRDILNKEEIKDVDNWAFPF